jgi:hypothetical protein
LSLMFQEANWSLQWLSFLDVPPSCVHFPGSSPESAPPATQLPRGLLVPVVLLISACLRSTSNGQTSTPWTPAPSRPDLTLTHRGITRLRLSEPFATNTSPLQQISFSLFLPVPTRLWASIPCYIGLLNPRTPQCLPSATSPAPVPTAAPPSRISPPKQYHHHTSSLPESLVSPSTTRGKIRHTQEFWV